MCGRFGRIKSTRLFADRIDAVVSPRLEDSPAGYNRPPGTFQACVIAHPDTGKTTLGPAWWGFVPNWATDTKLSPINARSETAADKKLFARSIRRQRCLIPADYWIEWQRTGNPKQPFIVRPADREPFFFAGIWSKATGLPSDHPASGQVTFSILTGQPNSDIAPIHHRQPQTLPESAARDWLNAGNDAAGVTADLETNRHSGYETWPVDRRIGNVVNNDAAVIERVAI